MYNKKYLKYKIKYLDLKSQVGGTPKANKGKAPEVQKTPEELTAQAEVQAVRTEARREIAHETAMINTNKSAYLNNMSEEIIELAKIKIVVAEAMAWLIIPSYKAIDNMFITKSVPTQEEVSEKLRILATKMKDACKNDTDAIRAAIIAEKGWESNFGQIVGILWKNLMMVASEKYREQRVYNKPNRDDQQWDVLEKEYNKKDELYKEREKFNPVYSPIIKANKAIERAKEDWDRYVKYYPYESYGQNGAPLYYNDFNTSIQEVILVWNWMKELVLEWWSIGGSINQALKDVEINVHPQVIRTWWNQIDEEDRNFKHITF